MAGSTEIAELVAKLTLDASQFTSNIDSLSSNEIDDLQKEMEKTARDVQHQLMLTEAEELAEKNAQIDLENTVLDTVQEFQRGLGTILTECVKTAQNVEKAWADIRNAIKPPENVDPDEWFSDLKNEVYALTTEIPESIDTVLETLQKVGKAGIDPENIMNFTKTVLQLKEASGGILSESEIINYFDAFQSAGASAAEDADNLSSAVLALGENTSATEKDILSMSSSIAAVAADAGMSADQILAWGAYMSDVGISSGNTFKKLVNDIGTYVSTSDEKLGLIAEIASESNEDLTMTAEDFKKAWQEDASGALEMFIEGLSSLDEAGYADALGDLGLKGQLYADSMIKMTSSTSDLTDDLNTANTAFQENTTLIEKATTVSQSFDAQTQLFSNTLTVIQSQLGDNLLPILKDISEAILPVISNLSSFISEHPNVAAGIADCAIALYGLSAAIQLINALSLMNPFTAWAIAIGGAIALLAILSTSLDEIGTKASETAEQIANLDPTTETVIENRLGEFEVVEFEYHIVPVWDESIGDFIETEARWDPYKLNELTGIGNYVTKAEDLAAAAETATEALNNQADAITEVSDAFTGNSASEQLTESIEETKTAAEQAQEVIDQMQQSIELLTGSDGADTAVSDSMEQLNKLLESEAFQQLASQPVDESVMDSWSSFGDSVTKVSDGFENLTSQMNGAETSLSFPTIKEDTIKNYSSFKDAVTAIDTAVGNLSAAISGESLETCKDFINLEISGEQLESWMLLNSVLGDTAKIFRDLMAALTGGTIGAEDQPAEPGSEEAGAKFAEALTNFGDAALEVGPIIDTNLNSVLKNTQNHVSGISQGFRDIVSIWTSTFKTAVKAFMKSAESAEAATRSLASAATTAAGEYKTWADAIWAVINALDELSKRDAGDNSNLVPPGPGRRASGGPVRYGETYLVGEEGPELFTPRRSGFIVPNDELTGGSRDSAQDIRIEINGSVYGESYLEDYVVKTMVKTIRRELSFAN